MDDANKRSVRNRRPNYYLFAEGEDPDLQGYSRPNYAKEYVSPALELNSAAKLLVRFINNSNKHLREKNRFDPIDEKFEACNNQKLEQKANKKNLASQQGQQKKNHKKADTKEDYLKNMKESNSSKPQIAKQAPPSNNFKPQKTIGKDKNEKKPANSGFMGGRQFEGLFNQYTKDRRGVGEFTRENHLEFANKVILEQQKKLLESPFLRNQMNPANQNLPQGPSFPKSGHKLFGRAAYHIAIAYMIHIEVIRGKGMETRPEQFDPTNKAKRLREAQEVQQGQGFQSMGN